jgi:uncharacterized SAM-binding protein YcdF (DUF218 family)
VSYWIGKFLSPLLLPPLCLILPMLLALACMRRYPVFARRLLGLSLAGLYILATPICGALLLWSLGYHDPVDPRAAANSQAIVLLGGGVTDQAFEFGGASLRSLTLERARYAAKLQRDTGLPLLATGGDPAQIGASEAELMARFLGDEMGVETRWLERRARNTAENAKLSAAILAHHQVRRVLLVTHAWHMRRAVAAFRHAGLEPVAAPTGITRMGWPSLFELLPSGPGMQASYYALHEWVGIVWYRWSYGHS